MGAACLEDGLRGKIRRTLSSPTRPASRVAKEETAGLVHHINVRVHHHMGLPSFVRPGEMCHV